MVANISPAITCYEDTLNTLKYAHRARNIVTHISKNFQVKTSNQISKYASLINNLKVENEELKKL